MQENYPNQEDNKPEILDMEAAAHCWNEECDSDMVYPIDWERADSYHHICTLRCPNCEDIRDAMMNEAQIERFDCLLDRGTDSLTRDLRNLLYANMATEINSFVSAMDEEHIVPDDFGIPNVPKEDECDAIIEQAHRMTEEEIETNMESEINSFVMDLKAGRIVPDDFGIPRIPKEEECDVAIERAHIMAEPTGIDAKLKDEIKNRGILSTLDEVYACQNQSCESDMVYPTDWEQHKGRYWEVVLRCPNCEECTMGIMNEELIERFDCLLDRGTDSLVRDLRNLTYFNMATEINSFVQALDNDHILPEDF